MEASFLCLRTARVPYSTALGLRSEESCHARRCDSATDPAWALPQHQDLLAYVEWMTPHRTRSRASASLWGTRQGGSYASAGICNRRRRAPVAAHAFGRSRPCWQPGRRQPAAPASAASASPARGLRAPPARRPRWGARWVPSRRRCGTGPPHPAGTPRAPCSKQVGLHTAFLVTHGFIRVSVRRVPASRAGSQAAARHDPRGEQVQ